MDIEEQAFIRHAVGADAKKRMRGYRIHYCISVNSKDIEILEKLVAQGFMRKGALINNRTDQYFHVTRAGCEAIGLHKAAIKRALEP